MVCGGLSESLKLNSDVLLTGTCPLMITSSAKRTLTGLDFSLAFLAALMKADLGDWREETETGTQLCCPGDCGLCRAVKF